MLYSTQLFQKEIDASVVRKSKRGQSSIPYPLKITIEDGLSKILILSDALEVINAIKGKKIDCCEIMSKTKLVYLSILS